MREVRIRASLLLSSPGLRFGEFGEAICGKMAAMTATFASAYLDAIAHLPAGATLILPDVGWDDYERLLDENIGGHSSVRITYDRGSMEVMSATSEHDHLADMCTLIAHVLGEETGCDVESFGSTTFKEPRLLKGAEPDACFYVQSAARIIGKRTIDLATDPPPDVMVEIDISHDSTTKMAIYASMSVPEVWRYNGRRRELHIYHLKDGGYIEMTNSLAFPLVPAGRLSGFLEQSKTQGQTTTLRTFRQWVREASGSSRNS
jgi:Uma2 family endonuclease